MLDKLLWSDFLLPSSIKKQIVKQYASYPSSKTRGKFFTCLKNTIASLIMSYSTDSNDQQFIQDNTKYIGQGSAGHIPLSFLLLKYDDEANFKLKHLFKWGLDPHVEKTPHHNLAHEVLALYANKELSFEKSKRLLNTLFKYGVSLQLNQLSVKQYIKALPDNKISQSLEKTLEICDEQMLSFLLNHKHITQSEKELLEYAHLIKVIDNIQLNQYYQQTSKEFCTQVEKEHIYLSQIEKIIHRGHIFLTQNTTLRSLYLIFNIENVENIVNNRCLFILYEKFGQLRTVAKKLLTTHLINKHKDNIIFNLLSHGLNLNWSIVNKEGQENIVALEVLHSLPMIKMILCSEVFNICATNTRGENILHLIGGLALIDNEVKHAINKKINQLSKEHKHYLFHQVDDKLLTPLSKAVYLQDELMIEFLESHSFTFYEQNLGIIKEYSSTLNFIDNILLPCARQEKIIEWVNHDEVSHTFWQELSKKYNCLQMHKDFTQQLKDKSTIVKRKTIKI